MFKGNCLHTQSVCVKHVFNIILYLPGLLDREKGKTDIDSIARLKCSNVSAVQPQSMRPAYKLKNEWW